MDLPKWEIDATYSLNDVAGFLNNGYDVNSNQDIINKLYSKPFKVLELDDFGAVTAIEVDDKILIAGEDIYAIFFFNHDEIEHFVKVL